MGVQVNISDTYGVTLDELIGIFPASRARKEVARVRRLLEHIDTEIKRGFYVVNEWTKREVSELCGETPSALSGDGAGGARPGALPARHESVAADMLSSAERHRAAGYPEFAYVLEYFARQILHTPNRCGCPNSAPGQIEVKRPKQEPETPRPAAGMMGMHEAMCQWDKRFQEWDEIMRSRIELLCGPIFKKRDCSTCGAQTCDREVPRCVDAGYSFWVPKQEGN